MNEAKVLRCAIYTRKSSEEGLEQDFNSLHAQREACEAYIKSQKHEGWTLVPTIYDDGGYSGGTLERPAIRHLLAEVVAKRIHVIVVYKVDRLTRSLADFARIVETLDTHGASFVSVTQQFNTTTSMGRLTLNVLLSFAQFEREVTGERIRDKIAASKKKGLWMGGTTPLGYAVKDRTLVIIPKEAALVSDLYQRYLALGSVGSVVRDLKARGLKLPQRATKLGTPIGGRFPCAGALYHLLRNPVYVGQIRHKDQVYAGQHPPIVDQATWDAVQQQLLDVARRARGSKSHPSAAPLIGKVYDSAGNRMSPTFSGKRDGRRYRAYVSGAVLRGRSLKKVSIGRIPAGVIETLVSSALQKHGTTLEAVARIVLASHEVRIERTADASGKTPSPIVMPVRLCKRGHETRIVPAGDAADIAHHQPDAGLVSAMIRAYRWRARLEAGEHASVEALCRAEGLNTSYVAKLLQLTFLAPDLTEAILDGRHVDLPGVSAIRTSTIPLDWEAQRKAFGRA